MDRKLFLNGIAERATGHADTVIKKLALEIFTGVVEMSPVKSGRFKGNWTVAHGGIPFQLLDLFDKEGDETIRKAVAKLNVIPVSDRPIYISNGLPYGPRLENGWSKKAPVGMVGVTLARIAAKYGI